MKARQERFKDQLTKLPSSTTGNSKPTAAGASDLEAKKKVRHLLFLTSSSVVIDRMTWLSDRDCSSPTGTSGAIWDQGLMVPRFTGAHHSGGSVATGLYN